MKFKCAMLMAVLAAALAADERLVFQTANEAYQRGQYELAIAGYRKILDTGQTSAALHFNLANAYHQRSRQREEGPAHGAVELGWAIFHYRQARHLAPRDRDIQANLQLARERVHGQAPRESAGRLLRGYFTVNEWTIAASLLLTCWLLLMSLGFVKPFWRRHWGVWLPLMGGMGLVLAIVAIGNLFSQTTSDEAVAIGQMPVHRRPLAAADVPDKINHIDAEPLRDGTEVRIVERRAGDWLKVAFADGVIQRKGWIRQGSGGVASVQKAP